MLFNSIEFLLFFPSVAIIYFILPDRFRNIFLLSASCFFYMSFIPAFIIILAINTLADFIGAHLIERYKSNKAIARMFLIIPLIINLGLLIYFKYLYFIIGMINFWGAQIDFQTIILPQIILPIGISFHAFQSMAYLIDVYRGTVRAEKNVVTFSLFLMFFPQLVAGPIERTENLMKQFKYRHYPTYRNISQGGRMILWGMLKKVLIADNLATFVDAFYMTPTKYSITAIYMAVILFSFQIYCDFSGYSDIAIGTAQVMGFKLMKNFDTPYFSTSMTEFWRRWHISLSSWFKDYVYIPLGGNRVSRLRWCFNQIVTFAISGLWHGASFTFIVWGILHGIILILERFTYSIRMKIYGIIELGKFNFVKTLFCVFCTFCVTSLTWILFRAETFNDAFYMVKTIFSGVPFLDLLGVYTKSFPTFSKQKLCISIVGIFLLCIVDFLCRRSDIRYALERAPTVLRISLYIIFTCLIIVFGEYEIKSFIYFQF